MNQIICSNLKCKYWKQSGICSRRSIILQYSNIATFNQGRKDILECISFKESKDYKAIKKILKELDISGGVDSERRNYRIY